MERNRVNLVSFGRSMMQEGKGGGRHVEGYRGRYKRAVSTPASNKLRGRRVPVQSGERVCAANESPISCPQTKE